MVPTVPRIGLTTTPSVLEDRPVEALDRPYVDAVAAAGGVPLLLPVLDPGRAATVVEGLDGLLLSGGGDVDPAWYGCVASPHVRKVQAERDGWEMALLRAALARGLPVLGICRGAQLLNVAAGGSLVQHLPDVSDLAHCVDDRCNEEVHDVRIEAGSRLHTVVGSDGFGVNSLHHQAVSRLGHGLVAVAWADDGTVEAIEGITPVRMLGVQWHPELLTDRPGHRALFEWLCAEAATISVPMAEPATISVPVAEPATMLVPMAEPATMSVAIAQAATMSGPMAAAVA